MSWEISLGGSIINFSQTVKNLSIFFDESLNFNDHIKYCKNEAFKTLKNLRKIRNFFDATSIKIVINSLICSKIDYCNSLFVNLPSSTLRLLQTVLNFAARVIFNRSISSPSLPLLSQLHWLPIQDRMTFKILLITYKAIKFSRPSYIFQLLRFKTRNRGLRHQDPLLLEVLRTKTVRIGIVLLLLLPLDCGMPSHWI